VPEEDAAGSPAGGGVEPAEASTEFVWVTGPLSPGLATRTTTLTFDGEVWVAVASAWPPAPVPVAAADAVASFVWVTGPVSPPLPTMTVAFAFDGEVWVAEAPATAVGSLPAGGELPLVFPEAVAWALFDCPTAWPLPLGPALLVPVPLPTSTFTLPFCGAV
jgi:hypothetical protein